MEIWVGGGYIYGLENRISNHMSIKPKDLYEAPATIVVEVKMESSLLQASLDANRNGYGDAIPVEDWI